MTEQTQPRRPGRGVYIFLLGVLVGVAIAYPMWARLGVRPTTQRNGERDQTAADRSPHPWAAPLADRPGLGNLHRVSDTLYRGAQPEPEGFSSLRQMGVRTVVNLRLVHGESEMVSAAGIGYEHIRVEAWDADDDEVVRFLKVATDPARQPVFVHCQHGSDRTGTMCAIYRIAVQGWSKQEAIDEMIHGGFGYHEAWENLVRYINKLDIERIRKQAGISETADSQPQREFPRK